MRYLIYGYYGYGNFGDDLLLRAVIEGIAARDTAAQFAVHSLEPVAALQGDRRLRFTGLARHLHGIRRKPWQLFSYAREFARWIGWSETLVIGGGTLFIDKGRVNVSLLLLLLAARYARLRRRRVVIIGVAIDRLTNPVSLWATRRIFAAAEFIALRDDLSRQYIAHVPADRIRRASDLVLGLALPPVPARSPARRAIGLSFIDYFRTVESSEEGHRAYGDAIVRFIVRHRDRYDFACIVFQSGIGQRDDWLIELLRVRFPEIPHARIDSIDAAVEMMASVDILVTTRYHLGILGVIWERPVLVIDHELKMRSLAEDFALPALGLDAFVRDGGDIDVLLRDYSVDRTRERYRVERERAALNFAWLDPDAGRTK